MGVYYYKAGGQHLFTIIRDSAIYTATSALSTGQVVTNLGAITALGEQYQPYLNKVICTLFYNYELVSDRIRWNIEELIPTLYFHQIPVEAYQQQTTTDVDFDDTFYWHFVRYVAAPDSDYLEFSNVIRWDRTGDDLNSTNAIFPIGVSTSHGGNHMAVSFIICNDDCSAAYCYEIWSQPNTTIYRMPYTSSQCLMLKEFMDGVPPYIPEEPENPYEDFPYSEQDSGEPEPDQEDDDVEEALLPTTSFADAGFCRIYRPSISQLQSLASYMWTDSTFLQTLLNHAKQILENPIDSIISLSLVPCVPPVSSDVPVKVMYINTGVDMPPVTNQFVEVDCGTYTLKEMYGSALDYNPYTSVQLYLPYIGIVQLDTDEVMRKTLGIKYRIDVVTGVCCAYVKAGADVLYQFSGHCSIQQPITSADFSGYVNAALAAGKLVASIAAAGAGAPAVAATIAGATTPSISGSSSDTRITERNEATGRQITAGTRHRETITENPGASFGEIAARGVSNTVGAVMNSKTIVQHSGGFSGNSGYLAAVRRPYLIITRPRIANPENYGKYNGRPSMIYLNLGDCTGYTQVQSIQLNGIDATNPELSEITTLLTSGVIL